MARKIGIFGGTFDPVHNGHVAAVVAMKEAHHLDSIFVIPAMRSPHKSRLVPEEAKHRLQMLKNAFKPLEYCTVLSVELKRPGPSYTIDTVRELIRSTLVKKGDRLYLLLGQDQFDKIDTWKESDELLKLTTPIVFERFGPVSSTDVRKRLKKKLYCGHLLNNQVYNYIQRKQLYD
ncbi:MAG: nicotinate (nicotinamide) nucleotide adenylyltransferase [Verrucomicrobia bacterium]|nr:nicotinate (nicotinamide) nucleotide adenylyltransferase [Verrucomicrobiota bacterium]MBS0638131.1 nicotinate (nicotinamide) nucleotide adenylyltransferase [Verrucomicrobiota bacterium]